MRGQQILIMMSCLEQASWSDILVCGAPGVSPVLPLHLQPTLAATKVKESFHTDLCVTASSEHPPVLHLLLVRSGRHWHSFVPVGTAAHFLFCTSFILIDELLPSDYRKINK